MRCDLHVHSRHSGPADLPLLRHLGRESYSEPLAVYERARRAGMDLVTLTDHDSIEGALAIAHPAGHNEHARTAAVAAGLNSVGGSDAHALAFVGRAHTVVPGARTKEEFLEGLRRGLSILGGRAGGYARLTAEVPPPTCTSAGSGADSSGGTASRTDGASSRSGPWPGRAHGRPGPRSRAELGGVR